MDDAHPERARWSGWLAFAVAWSLAAALAGIYLKRGWVPHDEGTLAQSAERLLRGELPHRDFDEIYTGGLSVLHALVFRLAGESLDSMRMVLFGVYLAWLPAVWYIARRFVRPAAAALLMLVAAAWSLPNYSAPVPSWYNLFLATLGTAALMRNVEAPGRAWLVVAGVAGGLSCLAKTPGLYFVAAGLLFLCYREGVNARRVASTAGDARLYVATVIAGYGLLVAAVALLVRGRAGVAGVVTFVAPVAVLVAALGRTAWNTRAMGASGDRFRGLASLVWPFAAGALAPAVLFGIPYAVSGSLGALVTGVFVLPAKRFTFASMDLLPLWTTAYGAGLALVFWFAARWPVRARRWLAVGVGLVLLWVLVSSRRADPYELVWYSVRSLLPVTVFGGALLLTSTRGAAVATETRGVQLVILLSVAAMCSLVQFPFAAPVYFLYIAPLALLATTALSATWDPRAQPARGVLLVFLLVFAVLRVNPGFIYAMGVNYVRDRQGAPLELERAHLRVTPEDKLTYERTVAAVQAHARGEYIWAGPDAPEVYFLSGKRNPTRTLFDFFDSPTDRTTRVLTAIDTHDVRVVVLHSRPPFSGQLPTDLRDSLERRFPRSKTDGWFQVRWRE